MLADIKERSADDYQNAIAHLATLMSHPNTELECLSDFYYQCSKFPQAEAHQRLLAEGLWKYFQTVHRNALPTCSSCAGDADYAEVCACHVECC